MFLACQQNSTGTSAGALELLDLGQLSRGSGRPRYVPKLGSLLYP